MKRKGAGAAQEATPAPCYLLEAALEPSPVVR